MVLESVPGAGDHDTWQGFACAARDASGYARGSELFHDALFPCEGCGHGGQARPQGRCRNGCAYFNQTEHLYSEESPIESVPFAKKFALLDEVDAFVHEQD